MFRNFALASSVILAGVHAQSLPPVGYSQITDFGDNPNNVGIYAYVPANLTSNPALVVGLHWCTGSAEAFYTGTQFARYADQEKSYLVIYGDAPRDGKCWDVSTNQTLTHDAGGDSLGIASAIRYAIANWGVDASRVFASGHSSGGMMSNVLGGAYPDLVSAIAPSAGVPYACFATTDGSLWNTDCAQGKIIKTGAEWGQLVKAAYPGYTGSYPKVQAWHGTADDTLYYQNFLEEVKEWTNVHGISETPTNTTENDPASGITHTVYGSGEVEAYSVANGPHNIDYHSDRILQFFGLL